MQNSYYGGIEAGGSKFLCVIGDGRGGVQQELRIPTTTPAETIPKVLDFFRLYPELRAVGIASFGPIDLHTDSKTYGQLLKTPKAGWSNTDIYGALKGLNIDVALSTDVGCAAIGEHAFGAGRGLDSILYMTIGTGIGGAYLVHNQPLMGAMHSEIGHMRVPLQPGDEDFPGVCFYHGNCFEGLACGPAMTKRWGSKPAELPSGHPGWDMEAHYLAAGIVNSVLSVMPKRVIVGGGVMHRPELLVLTRKYFLELITGYIDVSSFMDNGSDYIVAPGCGEHSAVLGALQIAAEQFPM